MARKGAQVSDGSNTLIAPSAGSLPEETRGLPLFAGSKRRATPTLKGHLQILRIDHWFKNVFVLPGIAVAVAVVPSVVTPQLLLRILLGLLATGLVASSNYVLNEILDALRESNRISTAQHTEVLAYLGRES